MRTRLIVCVVGVVLAVAGWAVNPAAAADNAADLSVKSDLRELAIAMETFYTDHASYPGRREVEYDGVRRIAVGDYAVRLGRENRLGTIRLTDDAQAYCVRVIRVEGASKTSQPWRYVSDRGGMQPGTCPDRFSRIVAR